MTVSMYNASVPVFVRMLENLSAVLKRVRLLWPSRGWMKRL